MSAVPSRNPSSPPSIVLIEDDEVIAELVADILEDRGMQVYVAGDAVKGLALATAHHPDLIVTDLHMPGLNGLDVVMATRREPQLKGTPVMVITGDRTPEMRESCLALGVRTYLMKPFDDDELLGYVSAALRGEA